MPEKIRSLKDRLYRYRAIFFIVGLAAISMIGVIHLFNISNQHNVELITQVAVKNASKAFEDLEKDTANMTSAALEALMSNQSFAERFRDGDREGLLKLTQPLFKHLEQQNGITHWYFINTDKTCFLRVHHPSLYGDTVTRITLEKAVKQKEFVYGKELGKTALALRAVHPYYYQDQLIGYMELAVEIEDFLKALKRQTHNEFGLMVKKEHLDRSKWASVIQRKNTRDNWDDMNYHVLVYQTADTVKMNGFHKGNGQKYPIPETGLVLEKIRLNNKDYVRGIFPFKNAAGKMIGGVFILQDITPMFSAMEYQKQEILLMILAVMLVITYLNLFFHRRAESELRHYRNRLEELVEESIVDLRETNIKLSKEIHEHKEIQVALEQECVARAEAEKKRIEAAKHAEQAARMASIGVMAAGITHEINQPLNAIKVTADSISYWNKRNPDTLPEPFVEQMQIISRSVERIVEIIQHMRTFWVLPQTPQVSAVDLNKAVKNALSLVRQQLHDHGVREQIDLNADPLFVESNLVHLEQVILNLTVNALRALGQTGQKIKIIEIQTYSENNHAVLVLRDNGPGLPTLDTDKLFDPFFSTNNGGEGMGLGLAIVKRYIDRYKGEIQAGNHENSGALFTIKFPLVTPETEGDPQ